LASANGPKRATSVILLAGGKGTRFSDRADKLTAEIGKRPIIEIAARTIISAHFVDQLVLVVSETFKAQLTRTMDALIPVMGETHTKYSVAAGGRTRSESVQSGLREVVSDYVLIHDGSRPLASGALFERVLRTIEPGTGAVPVVHPADSLLTVNADNQVLGYLPRDEVRLAQTPQGFITSEYRAAREALGDTALTYDDDGSIFLAAGYRLRTVPGERANIKITYPGDLTIARQTIEHTGGTV